MRYRFAILPLILFALTSVRASAANQVHQESRWEAFSPTETTTATLSEPIEHEIDFSVIVTPPYHCKVLKVWLPIAQSDGVQQVGESHFSTRPMQVEPKIAAEPTYGNKFAYFEFHEPKGAQIIRHHFAARVSNAHWQLDPEKVQTIQKWPAAFKNYLDPEAVKDQTGYDQLISDLGSKSSQAKPDLFAAMKWVNDTLEYDHVNASLTADVDHAFSKRRGHCSDYHGLCATMGRSLGYPTRVTYGLALFPKNSPSHCKLEAYLPPYGWVSFDLSETQKLVKQIGDDDSLTDAQKKQLLAAAQKRLRTGFRENSWLKMTHGVGYNLAPPANEKVRLVRTAYVEADGVAVAEPDPGSSEQKAFTWMTAHKYKSDKPSKSPFKNYESLRE
ncbi:MAG: transglutaminase domain-containing protein [Lacipirellulaceae bacterium]